MSVYLVLVLAGWGIEFDKHLPDKYKNQENADGARGFGGENVDDAAADRELAGHVDHFGAGVADGGDVGEGP